MHTGRITPSEVQALGDFWLGKIQEPSQIERLLEAFAARSGLVPEGAYRVRESSALSEELRGLLLRAPGHVWVSFSNGSQSWLFIGAVSVGLSYERNAPVLWVNGYSKDATLIESGAWAVDHDGKWRRCGSRATNPNN